MSDETPVSVTAIARALHARLHANPAIHTEASIASALSLIENWIRQIVRDELTLRAGARCEESAPFGAAGERLVCTEPVDHPGPHGDAVIGKRWNTRPSPKESTE